MDIVLALLCMALTVGISWWNSYAVGKSWCEAKDAWRHGEYGPRIMCWCGAVMASVGFSWVLLIVLALGAQALHILQPQHVLIAVKLGYILLAPAALISGAFIMVDSWARAYREGGVLNYGVAAYNTYAQVHNTVSAIETLGGALKDVGGFFGSVGGSGGGSSDDNVGAIVAVTVCVIVALSLLGGIALTTCLIRKYAGSERLLTIDEMQAKRNLNR